MRTLWPVLIGVSAALYGVGANAQAEKEIQLDIQPQVLVDALNEWAQATGLRLIGPGAATRHLSSPRLQGAFTPRAALDRLLAGTPLTYEFVDEGTVAIRERPPASRPALTPTTDKQVDERTLHLSTAEGEKQSQAIPATKARESRSGEGQRLPGALEEIVVTAQKRAERLQDVPISMTVLGGAELDRSVDQGMTDTFRSVPGVATAVSGQGGGTTVTVRGVGANSTHSNGSSPVAYYIDGVPFGFVRSAFFPDPVSYDLERVEVLRGPQGTLYGASALNGVVRILSKDADLDEFELKARASTSSTEGGDWNYRGDMAMNVPIVDGKLAARAVVGYQDLSGWIDTTHAKNSNDAELGNMRLKVSARPTEGLSIGLSAWLSRADYGGPSSSNGDDQRNARIAEPGTTDYDVYGLNIGYDFSHFSVASTTSYIDYDNGSLADLSPFFGAPVAVPLFTGFTSETFTQEINLNSTHDGDWRWTAGGIYRDASDFLLSGGASSNLNIKDKQTSESFAAYGEVTRLFAAGKFEITAGLRYFEDKVGQTQVLPPTQVQQKDETFDATTPRVIFTGHLNDELTVYASYAEGFRSGAQQAGLASGLPPLKPDTLKNYEVGAKGQLWGGRLQFDSAVFYIDWQDVQQAILVPNPLNPVLFFNVLVNGTSASGVGAEGALTARPIDGLTLGLNVSWNDLTLDSDVISGGIVLFDKGDRLNRSPEYTAGTSVDYAFPLGSYGLRGRLSASASYISEQDERTIGAGRRLVGQGDSMLLARTSFSIEAEDRWAATLYVDNVNNEQNARIRPGFAQSPAFRQGVWEERTRPRTFGVQLEYRY